MHHGINVLLCFRKRVNLSHHLFSHTIENFEVIAELPRPMVSAMAVDRSVPVIISALFLSCIFMLSLLLLPGMDCFRSVVILAHWM